MRVVGAAADQILLDLERQAAICREPADDLADLRHDLRADAVAGQNQQGRGGHGHSSWLEWEGLR